MLLLVHLKMKGGGRKQIMNKKSFNLLQITVDHSKQSDENRWRFSKDYGSAKSNSLNNCWLISNHKIWVVEIKHWHLRSVAFDRVEYGSSCGFTIQHIGYQWESAKLPAPNGSNGYTAAAITAPAHLPPSNGKLVDLHEANGNWRSTIKSPNPPNFKLKKKLDLTKLTPAPCRSWWLNEQVYPAEKGIELSMDMRSWLGIDSIKRRRNIFVALTKLPSWNVSIIPMN